MSCENHPDKPRFRNDQHRAVVNILYTCNNIASRLQQMLNGHNLTLQQFNILRILERQYPEPSCNCNIRKQMLDARSDITRIVDRLIKENLVIRTQCSSDRRKVNISLTGKGLEVLGSLEEMNEKMDRIMNILSSSELKELNTLLDKIRGSNRG